MLDPTRLPSQVVPGKRRGSIPFPCTRLGVGEINGEKCARARASSGVFWAAPSTIHHIHSSMHASSPPRDPTLPDTTSCNMHASESALASVRDPKEGNLFF